METATETGVPGFAARRAEGEGRVPIAYLDMGARHHRPIVLCHGLGAAGEQFAADASYFANRGFRVLVPDLRGHGRSGAPAGRRPEDFTIDSMASDLVAMLDDAGVDQVDWVGNSLGGIVALAILGNAPERFRTFATFGTTYTLALPPLTAEAFPWTYRLFGNQLTATVTARVTTREPSARPVIEGMLRRFDPMVGWAVVRNVAHYDMRENVRAFPRPVLLMRGGRDYRVNAGLGATLRAMAGRPNFTLVNLRGGGHCANLDATAGWRRALLTLFEEG